MSLCQTHIQLNVHKHKQKIVGTYVGMSSNANVKMQFFCFYL